MGQARRNLSNGLIVQDFSIFLYGNLFLRGRKKRETLSEERETEREKSYVERQEKQERLSGLQDAGNILSSGQCFIAFHLVSWRSHRVSLQQHKVFIDVRRRSSTSRDSLSREI